MKCSDSVGEKLYVSFETLGLGIVMDIVMDIVLGIVLGVVSVGEYTPIMAKTSI